MDRGAIAYLALDVGLFLLFAALAARAYSRSRRQRVEAPKYRMLEDD